MPTAMCAYTFSGNGRGLGLGLEMLARGDVAARIAGAA